jgi:VWFA-related protein
LGPNAADNNPDRKAPVTILALDLLNSSIEDFAYIRYEVRQFLMAQPAQLASPTELIVIGNESLELLQGYTRNRADLLYALNHLPAALPYKEIRGTFYWERFAQSIDALQQIALQSRGVPGRKNIVWVGHGGPNVFLDPLDFNVKLTDELKQYVHSTTNMLVDARISLFVLPVRGNAVTFSEMEAYNDIGDDDPFAGGINFGVFVNETGGKLFYNRNDVDKEIRTSEQMGAEYYTLTYQPQNFDVNGKFRRIRVTLRDPNLRAVTKAGYFAPDRNLPNNPRQQRMSKLVEAVQSTIPFNSLNVSLSGVVRYPDTRSAEFTVELKSKNVIFQPTSDGKNTVIMTVAAASLNGDRTILASKMENVTLVAANPDPAQMPHVLSRFRLTIRVPRKTQIVRVVMENQDGGRMGSADLDRKTIDAAPVRETPAPQVHRSARFGARRGNSLDTARILELTDCPKGILQLKGSHDHELNKSQERGSPSLPPLPRLASSPNEARS